MTISLALEWSHSYIRSRNVSKNSHSLMLAYKKMVIIILKCKQVSVLQAVKGQDLQITYTVCRRPTGTLVFDDQILSLL